MRPTRPRPRRRARNAVAALAAASLASGVLAACGSSGTTLNWYINPDAGGQDAVAAACSTPQYTIKTQVLPQDANQQRVQLARRLAAGDTGIDLMSIDPAFTAEFANADYLLPLPDSFQSSLKDQSFDGATEAATWKNNLVVAPFWSNVQVLWYRKSFVKKAGIDMSKPVTWDQIIDSASKNGGTVAVQANKYEGYVVWINALVSGAGGQLVSKVEKGDDATIDINSKAGDDAAAIVEKLARSKAAPADLSIAQEGQAGATFGSEQRRLPGQLDLYLAELRRHPTGREEGHRLRALPAHGRLQSLPSRPSVGSASGPARSPSTPRTRWRRSKCITKPANQALDAVKTGNMPASSAGYDDKALKKIYPASLLDAVASEPGPRGSSLDHAVLERHLRSDPEHVAPAELGEPEHAREVSQVHRGHPEGNQAAVNPQPEHRATSRPTTGGEA